MDPVKQTRKHDHSEDDSSCSHESWQEQNFCCPYMNNCPIMFQSMPMEQMPMNQMPMEQMPMNQMHCCPMPYNEMPYNESKCSREDEELEGDMRSPRPGGEDYHNHDYHDYGHHYGHYYGHYYPPYWHYPRPPYYKRPRPWWMY